jgi:hypothetical protein
MSSIPGYTLPLIAVVGLGLYFNGAQSIIKPTAQQSLTNSTFMSFIIYSTVLLAIILMSIYTKSVSFFFLSLTAASFVWFVLGKSWQYTPV